ncbi:phage portal protein [Sulfitobacter dubius]|uniref:phage portal protein n=1 Tax=Sulfitobacter dubius TaxID=218673 RepID=UPI0008F0188F|nr:phage portal protein [Sulfitobacter dubius]SFH21018.1 phage portal protein, HK97 family [Sulfitobacter dubius]
MGFSDLFRRRQVETRSNETLAALGAHWLGTPSGKYPAEQLAVTSACVGVISGQLAGLPVRVYRFEGDTRHEAPSHPLARLVRRAPNPWQSWPDFVEWLAASALLHGNGLAEVVTDRAGRVVELRPIRWGLVRVELVNPGRVIYHVTGDDLSAPMGTTRRLLASEVIHLRARTDDGLIGVAPLRRAMAAAEHAVETDAHSKAVWRNASQPGGVLMHEKNLSEAAAKRLKQNWLDRFGGANRGSPAVLEEGLKFEPFPTLSPEDAEILAARRFSTEEIARAFGVPAPLVGILDHASFTNSETLLRHFAQSTLAHWARKLETELSRSILTDTERETYEIDVDLSGLLRGDHAARWAAHKIALEAGVLTIDEVREVEGWSPLAKAPQGEGMA